jgi:hypothetical protein
VTTCAIPVLWALSLLTLCIGGCLFWMLPQDREASLRGLIAGVGLGAWLMALWWVHFGPR